VQDLSVVQMSYHWTKCPFRLVLDEARAVLTYVVILMVDGELVLRIIECGYRPSSS
jgi:hypothetical protein